MEFTKLVHSEWQKATQELAKFSEMKNEFEQMKKLLQEGKIEPVLTAK